MPGSGSAPLEGAHYHGPGDWLVAWENCTGLHWARFADEEAAHSWLQGMMEVLVCSELRGIFLGEVRSHWQRQESLDPFAPKESRPDDTRNRIGPPRLVVREETQKEWLDRLAATRHRGCIVPRTKDADMREKCEHDAERDEVGSGEEK